MRNTRGFTLIELLVIISIIAILSSVVLGSLQDARRKASNTQINNTVLQYGNAFELYRAKYDSYPVITNTWACVGNGYDVKNGVNFCGNCGATCSYYETQANSVKLRDGDATNNFAGLKEFIPAYPRVGAKIISPAYGTTDWQGAIYLTNLKQIRWMLEGQASCARIPSASLTQTQNYNSGTNTLCVATLSN